MNKTSMIVAKIKPKLGKKSSEVFTKLLSHIGYCQINEMFLVMVFRKLIKRSLQLY